MLLSSCQGLLLFLLLHSISSFDIGAKCETLSKASKQASKQSKSERDTKKLQKPAKLRAE
jgi:hypothetical protein